MFGRYACRLNPDLRCCLSHKKAEETLRQVETRKTRGLGGVAQGEKRGRLLAALNNAGLAEAKPCYLSGGGYTEALRGEVMGWAISRARWPKESRNGPLDGVASYPIYRSRRFFQQQVPLPLPCVNFAQIA